MMTVFLLHDPDLNDNNDAIDDNSADEDCDDGEQTHGIVSPLRKLTLVLIIGTRTLGDSITPKMIFPLVYCTFVNMIVMIILLNLGQIIIIRIILEIINDAG